MLEEVTLSIVQNGDAVEPFVEHELMMTANEMFLLRELVTGIARNPDAIPFLLQQLNAR